MILGNWVRQNVFIENDHNQGGIEHHEKRTEVHLFGEIDSCRDGCNADDQIHRIDDDMGGKAREAVAEHEVGEQYRRHHEPQRS